MSELNVLCLRAGLLALGLLAASPAEAQRTPAAAAVDTVRPAESVLQPGQTLALDLYGRRLLQARGVLVERNRTTTDDVTGRLDCRSNQLCLLQVAVKKRARAARYRLFLTDADRQPLLEVPFRLVVEVAPRGEEPDRIVTLEGEPGVSVQRSCDGGPYSTDMALLEPEANGGLVAGTELVWQRAEHEMCPGGSNKRYVLAICNTPAGECNPSQGVFRSMLLINITIDPDYMGNALISVPQADIDLIAQRGAAVGDTVYWQMRYQYDQGGTTIRGALTPKRPLTFNVPDPEPEPEPDPPGCPTCPDPPVLFQPNANTALNATNRNFSWSQTAGAQSWDLCFILPPATSCAQTLRRTQASLSGLTIRGLRGPRPHRRADRVAGARLQRPERLRRLLGAAHQLHADRAGRAGLSAAPGRGERAAHLHLARGGGRRLLPPDREPRQRAGQSPGLVRRPDRHLAPSHACRLRPARQPVERHLDLVGAAVLGGGRRRRSGVQRFAVRAARDPRRELRQVPRQPAGPGRGQLRRVHRRVPRRQLHALPCRGRRRRWVPGAAIRASRATRPIPRTAPAAIRTPSCRPAPTRSRGRPRPARWTCATSATPSSARARRTPARSRAIRATTWRAIL